LESKVAAGAVDPEHIDEFVEIDPDPGAGGGAGQLEARFFKVKGFCIVPPVLDRVHMIVTRHDPDLFELDGVDVQGDIEAGQGIDRADRVFDRGSAEIGKIDGVVLPDGDGIITIGIRNGSLSRGADDAYGVKWPGPVHIIYGTPYRHFVLRPCPATGKQQPEGKKNQ
jgi:hypothetical protein